MRLYQESFWIFSFVAVHFVNYYFGCYVHFSLAQRLIALRTTTRKPTLRSMFASIIFLGRKHGGFLCTLCTRRSIQSKSSYGNSSRWASCISISSCSPPAPLQYVQHFWLQSQSGALHFSQTYGLSPSSNNVKSSSILILRQFAFARS